MPMYIHVHVLEIWCKVCELSTSSESRLILKVHLSLLTCVTA